MQLRKRKLGNQVPAPPMSAVAPTSSPGEPESELATRTATPLRTNTSKKKKPPQDIGIAHLVLGSPAHAPAPATLQQGTWLIDGCLDSVESLQKACDTLARADTGLAQLIEQHGLPLRLLRKGGSSFATLAKSICFQQLATAAAAAIYGRVLQACACADVLTPAAMLAAAPTDLRAAGLSERKVSYLRDLATHYQSGHLTDALVYSWDTSMLHSELTKVKGLGSWSVDMFAMFHLGHPDILPVGDLGVRRGMQAHYGLRQLPSPAEMQQVAASWAPFRSVGSYFMWRVEAPRSTVSRKTTQKKE